MWAIGIILIFATFIGGAVTLMAFTAAVVALSNDIKRRNSQRHDVCRHCGYHVGNLDRCPECGLKSPART